MKASFSFKKIIVHSLQAFVSAGDYLGARICHGVWNAIDPCIGWGCITLFHGDFHDEPI